MNSYETIVIKLSKNKWCILITIEDTKALWKVQKQSVKYKNKNKHKQYENRITF